MSGGSPSASRASAARAETASSMNEARSSKSSGG